MPLVQIFLWCGEWGKKRGLKSFDVVAGFTQATPSQYALPLEYTRGYCIEAHKYMYVVD